MLAFDIKAGARCQSGDALCWLCQPAVCSTGWQAVCYAVYQIIVVPLPDPFIRTQSVHSIPSKPAEE